MNINYHFFYGTMIIILVILIIILKPINNFIVGNETIRGVEGFSSPNYYCVVRSEMVEEVDLHERCHILVMENRKDFCYTQEYK